jgi:hypothetical protein
MKTFLWVGGLIALGISVWLAIATIRLYSEAKSAQKKIDWARQQLRIAMEQIESDEEAQILAGLQTLSNLNLPEVRIKAMYRLNQLKQSDNRRIAMQAEAALGEISNVSKAHLEPTAPIYN